MPRYRSLVLLLFSHSLAEAQPAGAQAEVLFARGKELLAEKDFSGACASFEASEKLEASTATVIRLADCREKNQQYASAWGLFLQAERELRGVTDPSGVQMKETVKSRATALEPRLSRLTIRVSPQARTAELEILRDNDRIETGAWNQPLPTDGGTFRISARAPNRREWTTTIIVAKEGDNQTVDVPALATNDETPAAANKEEPARASDGVANAETPPASESHPLRVPIALGVASVALGVSSVAFEISSGHVYDDATHEIDRSRQESLWKLANTRRYIAEGAGIAAVGCLATAIFLYVERRDVSSSSIVSIVPTHDESRVGLAAVGTW